MIGEMCTKPVVTLTRDATVQEAARLMRTKRVGTVVITNNGKPEGILTDRDIAVDVVARNEDPMALCVAEVMRKDPSVIGADKGLLDAVKIFGARGIRRLPVVDRKGKLVGIIALDDLLILLGSEMGHVAAALGRGLRRTRL